jgi:hypothetical protein
VGFCIFGASDFNIFVWNREFMLNSKCGSVGFTHYCFIIVGFKGRAQTD